MFSSWSLLFLTLIYLFKVSCTEEITYNETIETPDIKRPFWNVAHMVNSLFQVDRYLDRGANSLEFDISFDRQGVARYTYHGLPCDCFRRCSLYEDFVTYLDYLRKLTSPASPNYRKELVLLFMDLKIQKLTAEARIRAGEDIAMKLLDHFWKRGISNCTAYVLISVPSVAYMDFLESFRRKMKSENFTNYDSYIGFDLSGNEDLDLIESAYGSANITNNIWQSDGAANCLPRGTKRLRECLYRRETSSFIDKVYWWTVDRKKTMRKVLRMGVDGMITNLPERLRDVLKEKEFSNKFKLATFEDSPWEKHPIPMETFINFLQEGREGNQTDFIIEDEMLYNCDGTTPFKK